MKTELREIAQEVRQGKRRALARAISIVENDIDQASELIKELFPYCGKAHVIGVTGSPGVGKSTLVDALISQIIAQGLKVAVLAIDPTSLFTGGAILGDRIRMQEHTLNESVFIRSMANRGHTGGTARATYDAVRMMEAAGFDVVIIETVGVGQSEIAIAQTADTTVLVLMPGSGDDVQAIKSGIMEIGDIFVVNKGDLPGANQTATDILANLELSGHKSSWQPPVLIAQAERGDNVAAVWKSIQDHMKHLQSSGELEQRRKLRLEHELSDLVATIARNNLQLFLAQSGYVHSLVEKLLKHELDPHAAAQQIAKKLFDQKELTQTQK